MTNFLCSVAQPNWPKLRPSRFGRAGSAENVRRLGQAGSVRSYTILLENIELNPEISNFVVSLKLWNWFFITILTNLTNKKTIILFIFDNYTDLCLSKSQLFHISSPSLRKILGQSPPSNWDSHPKIGQRPLKIYPTPQSTVNTLQWGC